MRAEFTKMLIGLAKIYSKDLTEKDVKFYADIIGDAYGFKHDWDLISRRILTEERFFPVPAVLSDYVRKVSGITHPDDEAKAFVDRAIFYFKNKPSEAYEALGKEGYNLAKALGLDPYSLRTGSQEPKFLRSQWIENYSIMKRELNVDNQLTESAGAALLFGGKDQ